MPRRPIASGCRGPGRLRQLLHTPLQDCCGHYSRWFNLMTVVAKTSGDIWIHREKDELWWTLSKSDPPTITLEDDPNPLAGAPRVYVCRKPCDPWSNKSKFDVPLQK